MAVLFKVLAKRNVMAVEILTPLAVNSSKKVRTPSSQSGVHQPPPPPPPPPPPENPPPPEKPDEEDFGAGIDAVIELDRLLATPPN